MVLVSINRTYRGDIWCRLLTLLHFKQQFRYSDAHSDTKEADGPKVDNLQHYKTLLERVTKQEILLIEAVGIDRKTSLQREGKVPKLEFFKTFKQYHT